MRVEKKRFAVEAFEFEAGASLPVEIGYETYGTLNEERSNAILICHYFSGTSQAGTWWESLVGPGKAFDTDRYYIIASDVICNLHAYSPRVITTGPATINPETGKPYGLTFPQVTIRDFVRLQKQLIDSLGVPHLHAVAGPSMGGMQSLQWAVEYPAFMKKVVAVITTGATSPYTSVVPLQIGIDAILHEPKRGLITAAKALTVQSDNGLAGSISRASGFAEARFHQDLDAVIQQNMAEADPYHWLYLARASQMFSIKEDLSRIQADVLLIPCDTDRLFPPQESRELADQLQAEYYELRSDRGHFAGVSDGDKITQPIREFLKQKPTCHA